MLALNTNKDDLIFYFCTKFDVNVNCYNMPRVYRQPNDLLLIPVFLSNITGLLTW